VKVALFPPLAGTLYRASTDPDLPIGSVVFLPEVRVVYPRRTYGND
jgi:hypothetical protein